jgi:pyruvate ferredoxin oxidoreductase beta subunit
MEATALSNLGKITDNGKKTIFTIGTSCAEVSTLAWPGTVAWGRGNETPAEFEKSFSIIHNVFESAPTVAEAVRDVSDLLYETGAFPYKVNVVSNSGDGGALAIGLRSLLHTIHRRSNIMVIVMVNEVFANTGFQYAPTSNLFADSATTPAGSLFPGNLERPIDYLSLAVTAGAGFVAQASPAFPQDFAQAVAMGLEGPHTSVIFVPSPCISGWKFEDGKTAELARLGIRCGLYPTFFKEEGKEGIVKRVEESHEKRKELLLQFLSEQRRFAHVLTDAAKANQMTLSILAWIHEHLDRLQKIAKL